MELYKSCTMQLSKCQIARHAKILIGECTLESFLIYFDLIESKNYVLL